MIKRLLFTCCVSLMLAVPGLAQASTFNEVDFSGTFSNVGGTFASSIAAGQSFSGSIVYDAANPTAKFDVALSTSAYGNLAANANVLNTINFKYITPATTTYSVGPASGTSQYFMYGANIGGTSQLQLESVLLQANLLSTGTGTITGVYSLVNAFTSKTITSAAFDGVITSSTTRPVSSTPIPAAVWLLGSGLAGLVGLKRKYLG